MKLSITFLSLLALAASLPVPEIHTVYTIAYTTVFHTVIAGQSPAKTQAQVTTVGLETTTPATQVTTTPATEATTTPATPATTTPATPATTQGTTTPATSATAPATSATSAPSSGTHSGQGTYYATGLGACGITNVDTDYIVAISHELYDENAKDANPNNNPLCGKKITAHYQGKSVEVTVVDRCEGCQYNDLDFSPSAFSQIADQDLGRIDITWNWA